MTFNGTHIQSRRLRPLGLLALAAAALSGCLDRPIAATKPETNNVFVKLNPSGGVDKIDILFMIDNSLSMGDKQEVLAAAVPQLLGRLTNPDCVDPDGIQATKHLADPKTDCPDGLQREFSPVKDIHIGVVTSALGDFGGDTCPEPQNEFHPKNDANSPQNVAQNDHGWLLGALPRTGLGSSFVSWMSADAANFGAAILNKQTEFANHVRAATELGCGNEMTLEGWYRFLIDPKPPQDIISENQAANRRSPNVDEAILKQRAEFLRPDSLVAVFMLADENDCSMKDTGSYAWIAMSAAGGFRMWRGSSACANDPNDPCCYSCMLAQNGATEQSSGIPQRCLDMDPTCRQTDAEKKPIAQTTLADDDVNMRCRSMKRRFGFDFLFPPKRYVNALTKLKICPDSTYPDLDCDCAEARAKNISCNPGTPVDNPLYVNLNEGTYIPTGPKREGPGSVFLAGVVGVPWQDLAEDPNAAVLAYKKATLLEWNNFAPKVNEDYSVAKLGDPLMIESANPRQGTHPITGEQLQPPEAGRMANSINGHEWLTSNKDVQFACIFSLEVPLVAGQQDATRVCDLASACPMAEGSDEYKVCARRFDGCSCTLSTGTSTAANPLDPTVSKSPLCQAANNSYGNKQFFAKGYPGLRELQVLRGFYDETGTDNAIVGSICPKDLNAANKEGAGYGYNPAVKALVDQLKEKLGGTCLPRKLKVDPSTGEVPCAIVEAISVDVDSNWCNCEANGRILPGASLQGAIKGAVQREGICGSGKLPSCDKFCFCQLKEFTKATSDGDRCLNQLNTEKNSPNPGFCYVDPSQGQGSADVVAACPGTEKRIIRIIGAADKYFSAPAPGRVFIACSGSAYEESDCIPDELTCSVANSTCVVRDGAKKITQRCTCTGGNWNCVEAAG